MFKEREANRKSQKLFSLSKNGGVPKHFKAVFCHEWYFLSRISCLRGSNKGMFFLTREIQLSLNSPF